MYNYINVYDESQKMATPFIQNDRKQFERFNIIIEQYIYDNELIIIGDMAISIVTNIIDPLRIPHYEIISPDAENHAKKLTIMLYRAGAEYVHVDVYIPKISWQIKYKERLLIIFNSTYVCDFQITPSKHNGLLLNNLLNYAGNEVILYYLYNKLTDYDSIDDWAKYALALQKIPKIEVDNVAGGTPIDEFAEKVMKSYITTHVLIGENAASIMFNKHTKFSFPISLISELEITEEKELLHNFASKHGVILTTFIDDPGVVFDMRIKKIIVTINDEEIFYIYNSGNFRLIPYNIYNNINVGTPYLINLYLLIEMWSNPEKIELLSKLLYRVEKFTKSMKIENIFPIDCIGKFQEYRSYLNDYKSSYFGRNSKEIFTQKKYYPIKDPSVN